MTYFVFSAPAAIMMMMLMRDGGVTAAVCLIMAALVRAPVPQIRGDENGEYSGQDT